MSAKGKDVARWGTGLGDWKLPPALSTVRIRVLRIVGNGLAAATLAVGLLLGAAPALAGPSLSAQVLPQLDLRLTIAGTVNAIVRQGDGKFIVGGSFTLVGATPRRNLARLNSDGSLDASWTIEANASVNALALDAQDNVYVGGSFSSIDGVTRNGLARVTAAGSVDPLWTPAPNSLVSLLWLDGNALYVGGLFGNISGVARTGIARVDAAGTGALDLSWNPQSNNAVHAITRIGSNLFLAGSFTQMGATPRNRLAKVTVVDGALDVNWNPGADGTVNALAVDGMGGLVVGGLFFNIGGAARNCIARVDPTGSGTLTSAWLPAAGNFGCLVIGLTNDGANGMIVVGTFNQLGGQARTQVGRVLDSGILASDWNPPVLAQLYANTAIVKDVLVLPDGGAMIVGTFDTVGASNTFASARLSNSGARDPSYTSAIDSIAQIKSIVQDPLSLKIYVAGRVELINGVHARRNIFRLNDDFSLDTSWSVNANNPIDVLAADALGRIYVGGSFTQFGGLAVPYLARLDPAGAVDAGWVPAPNFGVAALAFAPGQSQLYAAGSFTMIGPTARNRIARIATAGGAALDAGWNPNVGGNGNMLSIAVRDADGAVYVGGAFTLLGGIARSFVGKISAAGVIDPDWQPNANSWVRALAVDARPALAKIGSPGSIVVGGLFTDISGQPFPGVAAIPPVGNGTPEPAPLLQPYLSVDTQWLVSAGSFDAGTDSVDVILGRFSGSTLGVDADGVILFDPLLPASGITLAIDPLGSVSAGGLTATIWWRSPAQAQGGPLGRSLVVGGNFIRIGGQPRIALAAIDINRIALFSNGFE